MKRPAAPWIMTLVALLAIVFPSLKAAAPSAAKAPEASATAQPVPPTKSEVPPASPPGTGQNASWRNLLLPFAELLTSQAPASPRSWDLTFTKKGSGSCDGCEYTLTRKEPKEIGEGLTVAGIVEAAKGYDIEFLIALVPDPIDSSQDLRFDQGIEGLQAAFVDQGYLPDRFWFPWKTEAGQQELGRRMPGIWLFTRAKPKPEIKAVLLVGENPKLGVQKTALREAIAFVRQFPPKAGSVEPLRILGPSFSGSSPSLRQVLNEPDLLPYPPISNACLAPSYKIVTGTATAPGLEATFGENLFQRTVVPDDELQERGFDFLQDSMGWNFDKAALLIESDTAYGQSASGSGEGVARADRKRDRDPEIIFFPGGLSNVRTEWEKSNSQKSGAGPVEVPKSTLSLDLKGFRRPMDLVPEFSSVSPQSKDLVIANLLTAISRGGIRYVGILATDTRDKLFLAERIRKFAPDVVLFTFDNNLLYAHPEYSSALDGTLVLSSFPLFTANQDWREFFGGPKRPFRRQFASEFQQGIFQATLALLQDDRVTKPRIWISTVGNGSLWPLADFPTKGGAARPAILIESISGRTHLQLWLFELVLLVLGWWLWSTARPLFGLESSRHKPPGILLSLGLGVLWVSAAVLLILGIIPFEASWGRWAEIGLLTVLSLCYVIAMAPRRSKRQSLKEILNRPVGLREAVPVLILWATVVALPYILYWLWIPDRPEFFYFRARRFSSGLSPILSLLFWSAAVFVWVYFEIRRRLVSTRRFIAWPYPNRRQPALLGCRALASSCRRYFKGRLPSQRFWITFAILAIPPAVFLMATIQPITEPRRYGWVFTVLILFAGTLCAISFYRFLSIWLALEKVLKRLNQSPLIKTFRHISTEISWNPMKSFGWQTPSFNLMVLQAEKVKKLPLSIDVREIDRELENIFEAERKGDVNAELKARRTLNRHFSRAGRLLARSKGDAVEDFLAVRVVAYIRHAFLHLQYCLNQSLATALLVLLAVRIYAFEPKQFFSMCLWAFMIPAVFVTLWVFLEMDRDASLSAIGNTLPGKVTFNRVFFTNFFSYGLLPLLGILVSLFPEASRWLVSLINPLLRVTGIG
jgi:hypothetical protein